MYTLTQIDPNQWQDCQILTQFYNDLASNPYCTNDKGFSHIRTKSNAIRHAYIQPNHPAICRWLVFDIDDPQALFVYHDKGLPKPQIIIKNPSNGHAHYAYKLTTEVGLWGNSSPKAIRYLASVQQALRLALGADRSYGGNLIKNPCNPTHDVYLTGSQPSYTLAELAEHLDLEQVEDQESANDSGYGRNCSVFDYVRPYGYAMNGKGYREIISQLQPIAEDYNQRFDVPLLPNEIWHIVRSIGRYCSKADFTRSHQAFSERQAKRGANGGKVSDSSFGGKARSAKYDPKREEARRLYYEEGAKISHIAKQMNVHRNTVRRWIN